MSDAAPWEDFQQSAPEAGPWSEYAAQPAPQGGVMGALKGASMALENNIPFMDRAIAKAKGGDYDQNIAAERAKEAQFEKDNYWTNQLGGVTATAPLAMAGGEGPMLARMAKTAIPFGLFGTLGGASSSPDLTNIPETAKDAAIGGAAGALTGAAVPLAGAGIAKAVSPFAAPAERQAYVDILKQSGVNPTAGQITGNKTLGKLEAAAGDIPFGGGGAEVPREANSRAFTAALMEKAGAQPGQIATPENLSNLHSDLGAQFDALGSRNKIVGDPQLAGDLASAVGNYRDATGTPASGVGNFAEGIKGRIWPPPPQEPPVAQPWRERAGLEPLPGLARPAFNPSVPGTPISGDAYNTLRSEAGKQAQSLRFSDPAQAQAYREMQGALDDAMERSANPEDAGAFGELRGKYGNLASIEKAAGSAGSDAARGIVSPAQMRTVLASGNNRRAYARGVGDMAPLTNAGNAVLTNFPQSGTAPRILAAHLLGAGVGGGVGYHEGGLPGAMAGIAAPALGARALMSRPVQSLLANGLMRGGAPRVGADRAALAAALAARQQLPRQQNTE